MIINDDDLKGNRTSCPVDGTQAVAQEIPGVKGDNTNLDINRHCLFTLAFKKSQKWGQPVTGHNSLHFHNRDPSLDVNVGFSSLLGFSGLLTFLSLYETFETWWQRDGGWIPDGLNKKPGTTRLATIVVPVVEF